LCLQTGDNYYNGDRYISKKIAAIYKVRSEERTKNLPRHISKQNLQSIVKKKNDKDKIGNIILKYVIT
jgi:5,10-methylene-tetrahydrofolate dehydrogenase/methenyl tetrahydrofolate cyclohydrolase